MGTRRLPRGSTIPSEPPRRYKTSDGYVLWRWKVGPREYVEVLEHRVSAGRVVDAEDVHHDNENRTDNDPANLKPMTHSEHAATHHTIDRAEVARLYESGMTTIEVAAAVGTHAGNVSRILARLGVPARRSKWTPAEEEQIASELRTAGRYSAEVRARWPMSRPTMGRIARDHEIVLLPGRPN